MKWLSRIIAAVLFIFFFILALKNTQETALYFFWGYELRGPLVLRSRIELSRQKKKLDEIVQLQKSQQKTGIASAPDSIVSDGKPSETQTE